MILAFALCLFGVRVTLVPDARVSGAEFTLGDIASVISDDEGEAARVRGVSLGYAPAPGYSRLLTSARILEECQARAPGVQVVFSGATASRVWPQVADLTGKDIEAAAEAELRARFANRDATFNVVQAAPDLQVPVGSRPYELRVIAAEASFKSGRATVPVQILVDGAPWRSVWTTWKVELWADRPVPKADLAAGTVLKAEHLERRRVAVADEDALPIEMLIGATLTRAKQAGEALTRNDVVRETLVSAGQTIGLEIRKGAIVARASVMATESGARGDLVRVHRLDTDYELLAKVERRGLVVIELATEE